MTAEAFRFGRFLLDPRDRRLRCDDAPVELNARYLDALLLLVSDAGTLVSKDRFLDEVWRGVPVTDEALTQCVKTLRRQLGDDAANPRFIETVPKHGYRFVAPVERVNGAANTPPPTPAGAAPRYDLRQFLLLGGAGTLGAGVSGFLGGLFYGFAGASQPLQPGLGAISVLLVLLWLTIAAALMGGAGVGFGIAASDFAARRRWQWSIFGGAAGGLVVGGLVKLLGLDAFNLLLGQAPGDITGAPEGAVLGAAVGFGCWLASRNEARSIRGSASIAALAGGAAGLIITMLGGRLMGGSLDLLSRQFDGSRLRIDRVGAVFGESGFGPISQMVTGTLEGALFAGCVVGALLLARRNMAGSAE